MSMSNVYGAAHFLIDADYRRMGKDLIQPFHAELVQPASYDVTLGGKLLKPSDAVEYRLRCEDDAYAMDLRFVEPKSLMQEEVIGESGYVLHPGRCALVSTAEQVRCPNDMLCSVEGKSTIARCFLAVHVTAGFVDPGYCGAITLELVNHAPWPFILYPGMKIAQLRFYWLGREVDRPYGSPDLRSHYQGSVDVRAAEKP